MTTEAETRPEGASSLDPRADWADVRPAIVPRPTYWPAGTALGIAFLFWGIVTSPVVAGAGAIVLIVSLIGWIGEMRHEPEG